MLTYLIIIEKESQELFLYFLIYPLNGSFYLFFTRFYSVFLFCCFEKEGGKSALYPYYIIVNR